MRAQKPDFKINSKANKKYKIAIIFALWNKDFNLEMSNQAKQTLINNGVQSDNIKTFEVPGAFEIPLLALKLAKKYNAILCFATVIKGATHHFELVINETNRGIMEVSLNTGIPVFNGVLACYNLDQAEERASSLRENKGAEIALSALSLLNTFETIKSQ